MSLKDFTKTVVKISPAKTEVFKTVTAKLYFMLCIQGVHNIEKIWNFRILAK